METLRPGLLPVAIAYTLTLGAALALSSMIIYAFLSPFPPLAYALLTLTALFLGIVYAVLLANAIWIRATEEYQVGGGAIVVRRGWMTKTEGRIQAENVAEAKSVSPLLLRAFGVGHVAVLTNDGRVHVLHYLRDPQKVASKALSNLDSL